MSELQTPPLADDAPEPIDLERPLEPGDANGQPA